MVANKVDQGAAQGAASAPGARPGAYKGAGFVGRKGPTADYRIERYYTEPGVHPYDLIKWELRSAVITSEKGEVVFEQKDIEVPAAWSQLATNVVASKYFKGKAGTKERERSVKQLIDRVARTIGRWAREGMYFTHARDVEVFESELTHMLVHQIASFNSPVWFNVGIEETPQCSACFINSVKDTMASILDLAKTEGMLFKYGSGTGSNLSTVRSSREQLSTGGTASGPVSFMKGFDAFAGVIKSGGRTRRAAKMVILNADHPDIVDFIRCKELEERKAWALIDSGYDGSFNGEAYSSVFFQNSNNSVRVSDEFMRAVEDGGTWQTHAILDGRVMDTFKAPEMMKMISDAAWVCGDPGLQFDTTIQDWHTCPETGRINATNPCSEYVFLDDTACNLSSLNLMKFRRADGTFDVEAYRHACRVMITAQEILVDFASYPTPAIERNSYDYRPLGLGYANLGALLMSMGLAYDSDAGRAFAGAVTALMCGEAYRTSAEIASRMGPFPGYERNHKPMMRVIRKHRSAVDNIRADQVQSSLLSAAARTWDEALAVGGRHGFRNSQVTVLAPTGTIGFMMDCDTTGVEPDIALVKYKKLVGGGLLKLVNNTVPLALKTLGYSPDEVNSIITWIDEKETIEGAPGLRDEHLPVFDCAFKPHNGERSIHYMGHIRMMGAVQSFLSGAISKTVNMPEIATSEEIAKAYMEAWKLGVKAIAVYRDNSKRTQPLNTSRTAGDEKGKAGAAAAEPPRPRRKRLASERQSLTHKFRVGEHEGYITVGMYEDGRPGEIFVKMAKEGSVVSGLMDSLATVTSIALQYGVPIKALTDKFSHTRFEPSGVTGNPEIPIAKSIMDYIGRWLTKRFGDGEAVEANGGGSPGSSPASSKPMNYNTGLSPIGGVNPAPAVAPAAGSDKVTSLMVAFQTQPDAPPCHECGSIMTRNGSCYRCINCGATSGCS